MSHKNLRTIKCTQCGAPLKLHGGGHKIRSINCEFCGAVLDAKQNFSVLHQFSHRDRPYCPLEIGMQGKIKGFDFTIIGEVVWQDQEHYRWTDLMLYSETRGYAWLTYYDGHLTFSRRTRDMPELNVWNLAPKYPFKAGENTYTFYDRYAASIVYVAGELTWVAKEGDKVSLVEAIAPPYLYHVEHSSSEVEYGLGEYIEDPESVYQSFKVNDSPPKPSGVHPAQPYRSRFWEPLSKAAKPFALFAAIISVMIWLFFGGNEIYREQLSAEAVRDGTSTHEFEIRKANSLLELRVDTQVRNAWAFFDIVVRQGPNDIFRFGKEVGFYEGQDSDGYWSEGSRTATALFKVPAAGKYSLHITEAEGGLGEASGNPPATAVTVRLKEGYISNYYFILLLVLTGAAALIGIIKHYSFESKRWRDVMGGDD